MKHFRLHHQGRGLCFTIALLVGCGGSQPPVGAPGAMAQGHRSQHTLTQRSAPASQAPMGRC